MAIRLKCIGMSERSALFESSGGRKIEYDLSLFKSVPEAGKSYEIKLAPFSRRWITVVVWGIIAVGFLMVALLARL